MTFMSVTKQQKRLIDNIETKELKFKNMFILKPAAHTSHSSPNTQQFI